MSWCHASLYWNSNDIDCARFVRLVDPYFPWGRVSIFGTIAVLKLIEHVNMFVFPYINSRRVNLVKDRAHLSTFKFFILEKFSCIVVLIVLWTSVWFREKMTFFLNFISFHIFAIYVGGACWGRPAACRLIAVSGARLPSVDGLTVRYIKNAPPLNLPSKYVCDVFQTCFRYMYVWYKHTGTLHGDRYGLIDQCCLY